VIKIIDYDLEVKVKVIKIIDYDLEVKGKWKRHVYNV
jgi:hypothetical protein